MFGLDNPAILNALFSQFVTPERIEGIREIFTKAKEKGVEIRLIFCEGGPETPIQIYTEGRAAGSNGNFQRLPGFCLEITKDVSLDRIFAFMGELSA